MTGKGPGFLIRLAAIAGLLLSVILCALLIFIFLRPGRDFRAPSQDSFHRLLRDYDLVLAEGWEGSGRLHTLNGLLDKMEKSAQGVESWLSLLKRRRALAKAAPEMLIPYQEASRRAAAAFPWSEPLAAVAAASSLLGAPVSAKTAETLRTYTAIISDTQLIPLALGIGILCGDLSGPALAAERGAEVLLSGGLPLIGPGLAEGRRNRLIINLALLRLMKRDYRGAEAQIQGLSRTGITKHRTFLGEYYYDFGDPLRAAELWHELGLEAGAEEFLLRSADALWLGGRGENARTLWLALSGGSNPVPEIQLRSLYNLAASSPGAEEKRRWLGLLYRAGEEDPSIRGDPCYGYGRIAYTRDLDPYEALAILEEAPYKGALEDLEILRRRGGLWEPDRIAAETWLLLGRYPEDARLYQWAAWYFVYQRRRDDTAILIRTAGYRGIRGPWLDLSAALRDLEAGLLDEAEERLRSMDSPPWQRDANLGLILETRRAPGPALEHYETAAAGVQDRRAASRLQVRIAGCLRTLGRPEESRRALLYGLDLNPDNLPARLELRRLGE
ncbi:MAG: hypothetical protein LBQ46_07395 [Treponema sp.]|jgi:tetratricopeptide (TPR) repeat protein|nr:hypothetical protein [Treponema sp.]